MITAVRNSTLRLVITIYQNENVLADITNAQLTLMLKRKSTDLDSMAIAEFYGSILSISKAQFEVIIDSDSLNIPDRKVYFESIVKFENGQITRDGINPMSIKENLKHGAI